MKKLFICIAILSALLIYQAQAQSQSEPILFLEMEQTGLVAPEHVGVTLRVKVTSAEEASTLKTELGNRFFAGLTYTAKLHIHRTDGPCEVQDL